MSFFGSESKLPLCLGLLCATALAAQQASSQAGEDAGPLNSDRPGFSDGVSLLRPGVMQLETGSAIGGVHHRSRGQDSESRERYLTGGSPVFRMGLAKRLELRFGGDGLLYNREELGPAAGTHLAAGMSDLSVGFKVALWQERRWLPAVTVLPLLSLPWGTESFTSAGHDPTLKFAWAKSMPSETTLSGNWNLAWISSGDTGGGRRRSLYRAASLQLSRPMWQQLSGFGEVYYLIPGTGAEPRCWSFDAGVAYPVAPSLQVDVSAGQQIVPWTRTWFASVGISIRSGFPGWSR